MAYLMPSAKSSCDGAPGFLCTDYGTIEVTDSLCYSFAIKASAGDCY